MGYDPKKEYALDEIQKRGYVLNTPWDAVEIFEKKVSEYAGSKYAVAVDNCTNAIFLCLKYLNAGGVIQIPSKTYASIPMTVRNAGCEYKFEDYEWEGAYQLSPYPVYDSAQRFTKGMYIPNSYQCLSFHRRKILHLPKGGMILTDDGKAMDWFKAVRAKGRHPHTNVLYKNEKFENFGWNMYMTPERAAQGILVFDELPEVNEDNAGSDHYHDLRRHKIFLDMEYKND